MPELNAVKNQPIPSQAMMSLKKGFEEREFNSEMIEENFAFSDSQGRVVETNATIYADPTYRTPDYSAATVFNPDSSINSELLIGILAQCGAPFHFLHNNSKSTFTFWWSKIDENKEVKPEAIVPDIHYSQIANVLSDYKVDINPKRIIDVKHGRDVFKNFKAQAVQLSLWAIEATQERLVKQFGEAVAFLSDHATTKTRPQSEVTNVAVQILGATILAHTGALGDQLRQSDPSLDSVLTTAHKRFPSYFNVNLLERWGDTAQSAYGLLTQLRYSGFAPDMLSALYRQAYPDPKQRRELGRYDTPMYLTRRIWDAIPVEFLRPEDRVVADMTCGWGSFLVAAHERLSRTLDMENQKLHNFIYGNDQDEFTAQLAGLALLTSTRQDSWHIDHQDGLTWKPKNKQPNLIVGNPPFAGARKVIKEGQYKTRYERANQFLDHAIDILSEGGYLAMIMPQSFVVSEASPQLRKKLLEVCDFAELWELPIGIFEGAQANAAVIFAKKKSSRHFNQQPTRVRSIQMRQIHHFRESGIFTTSSLMEPHFEKSGKMQPSKDSTRKYVFDYSLILPRFAWQEIVKRSKSLESVVHVVSGLIIGKPERRRHKEYKGILKKQVDVYKKTTQKRFLMKVRDFETAVYPNEFEEPRINNADLFEKPKVVVKALANASWGEKVKAAIDREGNYFSNNFVLLSLKNNIQGITDEVIAAVVNWKVSNSWLLEHLKHTKFPLPAIRTIPFPNLTLEQCKQITKAVREIEKALQAGKDSTQARATIDEILRQAYQLSDETYKRLTQIENWDKETQSLDPSFDMTASWKVSGVVDSVDAEEALITLWVRGFDALQTVPLSPLMPGWMLRPEAAFQTKIPRSSMQAKTLKNNTSWGKFYPQDFTYQTEDELLEELEGVLS